MGATTDPEAIIAAATEVAKVFTDPLYLGGGLTCTEAERVADLIRLVAGEDAAQVSLYCHSAADEEGDDHFGMVEPTPRGAQAPVVVAPPSPAQLLMEYEAWRVQLAQLAAIEDRDGHLDSDAYEATDDEAAELARSLAQLVATLVGRTLADDSEVSRAGWLLAIDPRARKAIEATEAFGIDLTDSDLQELLGLDREWMWGEVRPLDRWLLIERNQGGSNPPWWVTFHDSEAEAQGYHNDQEYARDWEPEAIIDLDGTDG